MHIQVRTQWLLRSAFHTPNLQKWFHLNLFTLQQDLEQSSVNNIPSLHYFFFLKSVFNKTQTATLRQNMHWSDIKNMLEKQLNNAEI